MGERHESEWLFSAGELEQTPSVKLGLSVSSERSLRQKCILFILELARYLSCNHLVISSASIMFHRFMTCQAFQNHDRFIVCATCVFLAGKIEEQPKRLKDVVDVFLLIRSKVQTKIESELKLVQDKILVAERILLQTLGFDLQVDHPYGHCMHLLKSHKASFTSELARGEPNEDRRKELNEEVRKDIKRLAMNFLTDSFRGVLCLEFRAEVIATAVALLAVLSRGLPDPPNTGGRGGVFRWTPGGQKTTTWLHLFLSASSGRVSELELKTCCSRVIEVYEDKVIAIAGAASGEVAVKENNLLRLKLEEHSKVHADWETLPIVEDKPADAPQPSVSAATTATRAPPPPPPRPPASRVGNRPAPPPPAPKPAVSVIPRLPTAVHSTAPGQETPELLPPPTPDCLPPPTPENIPPPTPEDLPPPTPENLPPPTPDNLPPPTPEVMPPPSCENSDDVERAKKRRAEDREYTGNGHTGNGSSHCSVFGVQNGNGVLLENVNGKLINGRNGDGSSPPKKYKM